MHWSRDFVSSRLTTIWHACFVEQVSYLGVVGGITIKDTTRRILKTLFTNSLAVQYNYNGHGDKHAFGALTLKEVVNGMLSRVFISYTFLFICCA